LPTKVSPVEWIGPDHPGFDETGLIHFAHIPREATLDDPAPVVVMVHGKYGNESDMWIFKQTIPAGVAIVSPRAPLPSHSGGFVWFNSENGTLQPTAEGLQTGLSKLTHFIDGLQYLYPINPDRLLLMGFSQGAAISNAFALNHPDRVLGVASLAGAMVQPFDLMPAPDLDGMPVYMAHGLEDDTIPISLAQQTRDHYQALGAEVTYGEYRTGHKMTLQAINALKNWVGERLK
ncbi:MAG: dienelactone hydrolase family protein, partial [Anaerolineae bacterium]|nr:dienelactone hydrolase family protein [Anaerolineae bacterium]